MTRHLAALTTLLKNAFDFEHWLDPSLQIRATKELGLENFWPIQVEEVDPEPDRTASFWRRRPANTANTKR